MSTGIDLATTGLKLIQVRGLAGRLAVTGAARWAAPAPAEADGAAADALRDIVRRAPAPPSPTVVGITGREVNLQYTTMPNVAPHIFRAMMKHELEAIAGPAAAGGDVEVFVDYAVTSAPASRKAREGEYTIVIGRAKRPVVEERIGLASSAGLRDIDACPNSIALYQAVVAGGQVKGDETVLALDIGAEHLELAIVRGKTLVFARNVSAGSKAFNEVIRQSLGVSVEEAERLKVRQADVGQTPETETIRGLSAAVRTAAGQLGNVIESSLKFARTQLKRPDLKPSRCLLSGGGARVKGLPAYLQGALGIPVEWNEPFKALDCSALPAEVAKGLLTAPTDMAVALGLALSGSPRSAPVRLSLLPGGQKQRRAARRRFVLTTAAGALYALGLVALAASARVDRARAETEVNEVRGRLERYQQKIEEFDTVLHRQERLKGQSQLLLNEIQVGRAVLETVTRLQRILPDGMWVSSVALDRTEAAEGEPPGTARLKIRGLANEGSHRDLYGTLHKVASELGDPGSGIAVEPTPYTGTPDPPPGWKGFEFTVRIPLPEPPEEEKAAEGTEQP